MGRRIFERREGQGLVEFALVLPVLMLLLLGIVEFGLLLYNQHVITNASREGARYGIVARPTRRSVDSIQAVVTDYCGNNLVSAGGGALTIVVDPDPTGGVFGDNLTVDVTFDYDFFALPNFLGELFGGMDLHAHTTMKYE